MRRAENGKDTNASSTYVVCVRKKENPDIQKGNLSPFYWNPGKEEKFLQWSDF